MRYTKDIAIVTLPKQNGVQHSFDLVTHTHDASTLHTDRIKPKEGLKLDVVMCERMKVISRRIDSTHSPLRISRKDRINKYCKH